MPNQQGVSAAKVITPKMAGIACCVEVNRKAAAVPEAAVASPARTSWWRPFRYERPWPETRCRCCALRKWSCSWAPSGCGRRWPASASWCRPARSWGSRSRWRRPGRPVGAKRSRLTQPTLTLWRHGLTSIRRPFDCLSEVIKVTVMWPASRSRADLFIYLDRSKAARTQVGLRS